MSRPGFALFSVLVTMATLLSAIQSANAQDAVCPYGGFHRGVCPYVEDEIFDCHFETCPTNVDEPSETDSHTTGTGFVGSEAENDALAELWNDTPVAIADEPETEDTAIQCLSEHDPEYDMAVYGVDKQDAESLATEDAAAAVVESENIEATSDEQYGDVYWYDDYADEFGYDDEYDAVDDDDEVEPTDLTDTSESSDNANSEEQANSDDQGYAWDEELDDYEYGYWYDEYGNEDYESYESESLAETTEAVSPTINETVEHAAAKSVIDESANEHDYDNEAQYDDDEYWYDEDFEYNDVDEIEETNSDHVTQELDSEEAVVEPYDYDYEGYGEYEYDYDYEREFNRLDTSEADAGEETEADVYDSEADWYDEWYYGEYDDEPTSETSDEASDEIVPTTPTTDLENEHHAFEADDPWSWDACNEYFDMPQSDEVSADVVTPLQRLATGCGRQVVIDAAKTLDGIGNALIATSRHLLEMTEQR